MLAFTSYPLLKPHSEVLLFLLCHRRSYYYNPMTNKIFQVISYLCSTFKDVCFQISPEEVLTTR